MYFVNKLRSHPKKLLYFIEMSEKKPDSIFDILMLNRIFYQPPPDRYYQCERKVNRCIDAIIQGRATGIVDYSPCMSMSTKKVACWPVQKEVTGSITVPSSVLVGREADFLSKQLDTSVEITNRGFSSSR